MGLFLDPDARTAVQLALAWLAVLLLVAVVTFPEETMNFIRNAAKAVTAFIVSGATSLAAQYGLDLTDAQVTALTTALTTVLVYLIPNKANEA